MVNVQATLTDLTAAGLTVAVYEETGDPIPNPNSSPSPSPNPNPKSNPNSVLTWTLTGKTGAGAGKLTKTRELLQVRHLVITP